MPEGCTGVTKENLLYTNNCCYDFSSLLTPPTVQEGYFCLGIPDCGGEMLTTRSSMSPGANIHELNGRSTVCYILIWQSSNDLVN